MSTGWPDRRRAGKMSAVNETAATHGDPHAARDEELAVAARWIADARRVVALTGAGISTGSGIPDFRGPNGVWTKNPAAEKASSLQHYLADPELRRLAWQNRLTNPVWGAEPNVGHRALVHLERQGRLHAVVTQNIDGLHQRAGHDPERVVEVHGTVWFTRCWTCGDRLPMHEVLERVRSGEDDPECLVCRAAGRHGILKSDTISFGQALVPEVIDAAFRAAEDCDLFLALGSTLSVQPVASTVPTASRSGARVVIVNGEPTAMDHLADAMLLGSLADIVPRLVAGLA